MDFETLNKISVNGHTENKNGLTYLSWTWAWSEIKKQCPEAQYEILKFENNLPYVYDENTGYMVFTRMTINNQTYEMWLPVIDGNNKAMLNHPYTYKVKEYENGKFTGKYKEKLVECATMFDINKTIMRCLVKNIAMFGLGIYIYAGEDMPEGYEISKEEAEKIVINFGKYNGKTLGEIAQIDEKYLLWLISSESAKQSLKDAISKLVYIPTEEEQNERLKLIDDINFLIATKGIDLEKIKEKAKIQSITELSTENLIKLKEQLEKRKNNE